MRKSSTQRMQSATMIVVIASFVPDLLGADQHGKMTVKEAAPVLGRIIQKNLQQTKAEPGPVQWAHVPGRGLLYMVAVKISGFDSDVSTDTDDVHPSANDLVWQNAHRELSGQPTTAPDEAHRVAVAIEAVRNLMRDYADRIPLPEGEQVRTILFGRDTWQKSQWRNWPIAGRTYEQAATSMTALALQQAGLKGTASNQWTVISKEGVLTKPATELANDARVLARVLDKKLRAEFPKEFWGVDTHGRPGAEAVVAGDWGPVLVLNMTFPIEEDANQRSGKDDIWLETLNELHGEIEQSAAKLINAARLVDIVKETLADFGGRLRGLNQEEAITVLVYGQRSPSVRRLTARRSPFRNAEALNLGLLAEATRRQTFYYAPAGPSAPTGPGYVLQVAATDLQMHRSGSLDRKSLLEKIWISQEASGDMPVEQPKPPRRR